MLFVVVVVVFAFLWKKKEKFSLRRKVYFFPTSSMFD